MKNFTIIFTLIMLSIGCSKESDPVLDVKIEMTKSDIYEQAVVNITEAFLFEKDIVSGEIAVSNIQQWDGIELNQDLTKNETNDVLESTHWELELAGVKPSFSIAVNSNNDSQNVSIDYIEYIAIHNLTALQKDKEYEITISIDTDNAIIEDNGALKLNWDYVTSTIKLK